MQQAPAENRVRLHLSARFESDVALASGSLSALQVLVDAFLGPDRGPAFSLACHEAVMNAIIHAHGLDRSKMVTLEFLVGDRAIEARIGDEEGQEAVAARYETPLDNPYLDKDIADLPESGVGAWLIQQGADEVSYERYPGGGRLILRVDVAARPPLS